MALHWKWAAVWMGLLVCASCARAQELGSVETGPVAVPDVNVKLRLQLDRTTIKANEPVYISVTAERFATKIDPNIQVSCNQDKPLDLGRMGDQWLKSDLTQSPMRLCIMLADTSVGGDERYLFSKSGEYTIRVKIGPDATPLKLKVEAGPASDAQAFVEIGPSNFKALLTEEFGTDSPRDLFKICQTVVKLYPDSTVAGYCRAYIAIAEFKIAYTAHHLAGGPPVWEPVAFQLDKTLPPHRDDFFGEEIGFYLAYAQGLSRNYLAMAQTINSIKTHMTPWADRMDGMKKEVSQHVKPEAVDLPPRASGR